MNDKQLKTMMAVGMAAVTVAGCGGQGNQVSNNNDIQETPSNEIVEEFKPELEYEVDVYGPAPYFEPEEDNTEVLDGTDKDNMMVTPEKEEDSEENFEAEVEKETTKYGAYILSDKEKDKVLKEDFEASVDDVQISLMYGPKPTTGKGN